MSPRCIGELHAMPRKRAAPMGFNTETSPGPAIPPMESLRRMLPADKIWPINEAWNFHSGGGAFKTVNIFTEALNKRFGEATNLGDYTKKAQVMAYDGERAMFEAYGRNKYDSTGVIQWMMNNAWPSMMLASLRLLPAARRRLFRHEESVRTVAHSIFLRRPLRGGGQRPLPGFQKPDGHGENLSNMDMTPKYTQQNQREYHGRRHQAFV